MKKSTSRAASRAAAATLAAALLCGTATALALPAHAADLIPVPKTDYQLAAVSSQADPYPAPPALDGTAAAAFDGDYSTQWVSRYTDGAKLPQYLSIDMQRSIEVAGVEYSDKKGQSVAAQTANVYVTDDPAIAKTAPADGKWGSPAAQAQLHRPAASDEKQRIAFSQPVTGRYLAFEVTSSYSADSNNPAGGAIGELQIYSDQAIPPITKPTDPGTGTEPGTGTDPGTEVPSYTISSADSSGNTSATVAKDFPFITGYTLNGATLGGQKSSSKTFTINGKDYSSTTSATAAADSVTYVSKLAGLDVSITSQVKVTGEGTIGFAITKIDGADAASVNTLALPGNQFLSVPASAKSAQLDRTVVSPDSRSNADEHIALSGSQAIGNKAAAYAFLGDSSVIGSVITNATVQDSPSTASWNGRLTTHVDVQGAAVGSTAWLVHPTGATDPRVTTFEMPQVTVLLSQDANADGVVNWQDAGIKYRSTDAVRLGASRVPDRVVDRIPFNFASSATNYFDLVLDNTKRIANDTDGLGQWVLNKGYGNEGHDSNNTDYGDDFNERAGGVDGLNNLVTQGGKLNADMSVHVNATEIYPQAKSFSPDLLRGNNGSEYQPGWNWLDQSYYIDQQKDLGSGAIVDRFQQLKDAVPGLSGVYIDTYYSNGWVAEGLADQLHNMGFEVESEWADKFVDDSIWSHWANDLNYGGASNKGINSTMVRFIQNGQADIWNDDPLLGQQRLVDAEGWQGNKNWNDFTDNIWQQSLPTKFIQHFDLQRLDPGKTADLSDGVHISMDGTNRVITMDGAEVLRGDSYLLPWQSLASNKDHGSPTDADKMYYYSASGGSHTFGLTGKFAGVTSFTAYKLGDQGRGAGIPVTAAGSRLTFTGDAGAAYVIVPNGSAQHPAASYDDSGLQDPGFNSGALDPWNPTGTVSLQKTNEGEAKNQSANENIASFGPAASGISQTVTGLKPGTNFTFSAQVQIGSEGKRPVTMSVDTGANKPMRTWDLSPTLNTMRADSKSGTHFQRASVAFTAPSSGKVTVAISAAAGAPVVSIDNGRIMADTTSPTAAGVVFSTDFEGNQPGYQAFVLGDADGIDDPRTSISRRHDPYSGKDWRNTAKPYNSGATQGMAVDSTLDGEHSLFSHQEGDVSGSQGIVYRTDPTTVSLAPGHNYQVKFKYQVGATGAYRWAQGIDTLDAGKVTSTVQGTTELNQALNTSDFSQNITTGCGDSTWVGLQRVGSGPAVDFTLDDFSITDLGATSGGATCATVGSSGATLNPGTASPLTTTFTNSEKDAVSNVGVTLSASAGYTVQVADGSANVFASVKPGESVKTTWLVTAPESAKGTDVSFDVAATYLDGCDVRTAKSSVKAAVSARAQVPDAQISATADSAESEGEDGSPANMLDGNPGTIWHTQYNPNVTDYPHWAAFDLGSVADVDGISYLRRPANKNGPIKDYTVSVSADGKTYAQVAAGTFADSGDFQDVNFASVKARYVKLDALSSISGTPYAAAAEVKIYGTGAALTGHAPATRGADDVSACHPVGPAALSLSADPVKAGDSITVTLAGFTRGKVSLQLHSAPVKLGTVNIAADGTGSAKVTIPAGTAAGKHQIAAVDSHGKQLASVDVTVTAKGSHGSKPPWWWPFSWWPFGW